MRLVALVVTACLLCACNEDPPSAGSVTLPVTTVELGGRTIRAEVAHTDKTRQKGLMYRESLAPDSGMLFVFDAPVQASFWMKNTLMDLDIAFIDRRGRITNTTTMTKGTTTSHKSTLPVRYALEMEAGYFAKHGIKAGDVAEFTWPPASAAPSASP